jgi:Flp pilus assembly protein TadG
MSRFKRDRRGSYALEFALMMPILAMITGAMADYGSFMMERSAMVQAIRHGARIGALTEHDADPGQTAIDQATQAFVDSGIRGTPSFTSSVSGTAPHQVLQVSGSMPYSPFFAFVAVPDDVAYDLTIRLSDQAPI